MADGLWLMAYCLWQDNKAENAILLVKRFLIHNHQTKSEENMSEPLKMLLWPDGAPGAKGDAVEDKPDLTLYMPENYDISKPRGLVVVLPGGGYHFKAAHEGEPIAKMLNAAGIPAVVVQYRVSPYRYPILHTRNLFSCRHSK